MLNAVTNYTVFYSYDTNLNEYIPVSSSYSTDNYTNVVDMTTYLVNVPYAITNIYQPVAPAAPITNVVMTSYLANIAPAVSTLFSGNDTNINQIAFGDGKLDVCDVYVTFRRSLDTNNLVWFQRFWTNGVRAAVAKPAPVIQFGSKIATKPATAGFVQPKDLSSATSSVPPLVVFAAGNTNATAGSVMHIPITATITGNYNLRVLMMNLSVLPAAGAPTLTTELSFSPGVLGSPTSGFTDNSNSGYYTAAWLDGTIAGVTGTVTLGTLTVTIPSGAPSGSSYTVNFAHASASPNGLASFPALTTSGTIMVQ